MSNEVRRLPKHHNAHKAVMDMIQEMSEMWSGFNCDGEIISSRNGAYVKVEIPMSDCPDAWTRAIIFRNGDEYVCVVDCYIGEDSEFQGTEGNWYTVDDCWNLILAA